MCNLCRSHSPRQCWRHVAKTAHQKLCKLVQ
nr:MAG TPA: hypothetical protein [Caudoviricetes sp.]